MHIAAFDSVLGLFFCFSFCFLSKTHPAGLSPLLVPLTRRRPPLVLSQLWPLDPSHPSLPSPAAPAPPARSSSRFPHRPPPSPPRPLPPCRSGSRRGRPRRRPRLCCGGGRERRRGFLTTFIFKAPHARGEGGISLHNAVRASLTLTRRRRRHRRHRRSGAGAYGTRRRIVGIRGEGDVKGPRPGADLREAPAQ